MTTCSLKTSGYECPACRIPALEVVSTDTYACFIMRTRRCLFCGHIFKTIEAESEVERGVDLLLASLRSTPDETPFPREP